MGIMDSTQEQRDAYLEMQRASGIGVGDTVRVLSRARSYQHGWGGAWCEDKEEMIGKTHVVKGEYGTCGFGIAGPDGFIWHLPCFVMELVNKDDEGPNPEIVMLSSKVLDYKKDGSVVNLGPHRLTLNALRKVVNHMEVLELLHQDKMRQSQQQHPF